MTNKSDLKLGKKINTYNTFHEKRNKIVKKKSTFFFLCHIEGDLRPKPLRFFFQMSKKVLKSKKKQAQCQAARDRSERKYSKKYVFSAKI